MITDNFTAVWPDVARPLAAMLRRRGVSSHDADEIVQETAARAFGSGTPFTDADDLYRWASVVGWRLAIDARRRRRRISDAIVPERVDPVDVAVHAEHRIALDNVRDRFAELSPRDREVLLSSFEDVPVQSRRESVRLAVARHRARTRLRALLDGLAAPIFGLWARRHRILTLPSDAAAAGTAPVAALFVVSVVMFSGGSVDRQLQDPTLRSTTPVTVIASSATETTTSVPPATPTTRTTATPPPPTPPPDPPAAEVSVPTPTGKPASADIRPKQATDGLACVTPPPVIATGNKTCVGDPLKNP